MKKIINDMLQKSTWAVIGASNKKDRYGYKIYMKLKKHNYNVYAINPGYEEVDGEKCYSKISELPSLPNCISMVVNPKIAKLSLLEIKNSNIELVWFQPGSYNDEVLELAKNLGITVVYNACVLVELSKREHSN